MKEEALLDKVKQTRKLFGANGHAGIQRMLFATLGLVEKLYGAQSPQLEQLRNIAERYNVARLAANPVNGEMDTFWALSSVLSEIEQDMSLGLFSSIRLSANGEVLADFVLLAKEELTAGHKDVSAVLISAAFEDGIKRIARHHKAWQDGELSQALNALKGKRIIEGAQAKFADACLKLRNYALHADWSNINEPEVLTCITFVEGFLITKFQ